PRSTRAPPAGELSLLFYAASRDHLAPLGDLALDESLHLLGARRAGLAAEIDEALARIRARQRLAYLGVQPLDDLSRRAAARAKADEGIYFVALNGLRHRRHVRQRLPALARRHGE